jgi:hypothetical protein
MHNDQTIEAQEEIGQFNRKEASIDEEKKSRIRQ